MYLTVGVKLLLGRSVVCDVLFCRHVEKENKGKELSLVCLLFLLLNQAGKANPRLLGFGIKALSTNNLGRQTKPN